MLALFRRDLGVASRAGGGALTGVLFFREPFGPDRLVGFACIWAALLIFAADGWRVSRRR